MPNGGVGLVPDVRTVLSTVTIGGLVYTGVWVYTLGTHKVVEEYG